MPGSVTTTATSLDGTSGDRGLLAVLLGIDGAGKSSVLRGLRAVRPGWTCISIDPVDLYPLPGLDYMNWALHTHPRTYVARMGPRGRATYLAHTLSLLYEQRILPSLNRGQVVVCDSYYYRVWAKERLLGPIGGPILAALAAELRVPDLAIWLDVPIEVGWRRNGERCAFYEAIGECSWEGFRRMQIGVERLVLGHDIAAVPVRRIDGSPPLARIVEQVTVAVNEAILARPAPVPTDNTAEIAARSVR